MKTGLKAVNGMVGVPEIGCGDNDGIKVFFFIEHFLIVNIGIVLVAIFLQQA